MNLKSTFTKVACIISAFAIMALLYTIFFSIINTTFSFNISSAKFLDFIESLSWKYIFFVLGGIMFCFQCLFLKENKPLYLIGLIATGIILVIFTILCVLSNNTLIKPNAIIYTMGICIASLSLFLYKVLSCELVTKIIGSIVIMAITILLAINVTPNKMESEIDKVAQKYENSFKELGYVAVRGYILNNWAGGQDREYTKYSFKRYTRNDKGLLLNLYENEIKNIPWVTSYDKDLNIKDGEYDYRTKKLYEKNLIIFSTINLYIEDNKLYIENLQYNPTKITQQELAERLDVIMKYLIMPQLKQIKKEEDEKRRIIQTYEKQ